jgi:hypothetical protein
MDVCGRRRVPLPPHWMTAFMLSSVLLNSQSFKYFV